MSSSYTDAKLWLKWREHHRARGLDPDRISKDGIVSPRWYDVTRMRIAFVAKETNDYAGGDMRPVLFSHDRSARRFSDGIGRWALGLLNDFPALDPQREAQYVPEGLGRIATVNLKKQTGGSTANYAEVLSHAMADRALLILQLQAIRPSRIVTCGTEILKQITKLELTAHEHFYRSTERSCPIIAFRYPVRASRVGAYDDLRRRIEETRGAEPGCGI